MVRMDLTRLKKSVLIKHKFLLTLNLECPIIYKKYSYYLVSVVVWSNDNNYTINNNPFHFI